MGDPITGIKCAALCAIMAIIMWILHNIALAFRLSSENKFFISNYEAITFILMIACIILTLICLGWSTIAWIAS